MKQVRAMRSLGRWSASLGLVAAGIVGAGIVGAASPAGAQSTPRSGHPPTLQSATIDASRRLVVTYAAPDGVTYGGSVYLDSDPRNANTPAGGPYGSFMYCNNKSTCLGRWSLVANSGTGPFTFTSPTLDPKLFPEGTYWVQVETTNEDPFPSTRQWEDSNVLSVVLPAATTTTIVKPPASTRAPGSASPDGVPTTLAKIPPAVPTGGTSGNVVGVANTKDCPALKAGGFYEKIESLRKAAADATNSLGTRQKAANSVASIEACQKAEKAKEAPKLPAGAKVAQDEAVKARTAAEKAKREFDQALQRARDLLAKANAATTANAPNAATLRSEADQAKRAADAKGKVADTAAKSAATATGRCRRFQSTVDKRITFKCR